VKKAGLTNLFEIKAGEIAQQKSQNSKVRDYAKIIVDEHRKAQRHLKAAVEDFDGASVPTSGLQFLRTFKRQQVKSHKEGVKLFKDYAQAAEYDPLKRFAQETLPALEKHLRRAQELPAAIK
jgi:putative membrane protein